MRNKYAVYLVICLALVGFSFLVLESAISAEEQTNTAASQKETEQSVESFVPTESISADNAVPFPSDI